jgi:hypothetical protein
MLTFTDDHNFHGRNFPALFRTVAAENIRTHYHRAVDTNLKRAWGDYTSFQATLSDIHTRLSRMPPQALRSTGHKGVTLFQVCKYELLQYLMTDPRWYDSITPNDDDAVFDKALRLAREPLLWNLAAAWFWVDHWATAVNPQADFAAYGLFGNSLSYTRALSLQANQLRVLPICFEHFFTGHDHFMEARTSAIQGYSELRIAPPESAEIDEALVWRRLGEMNNKNVRQASFRRSPLRGEGRTILLLAQVVNDFAALTPGNRSLGTVALYKELLREVLTNTPHRVIVKTHPYEASKTRGLGAITFEELRAFVARLGPSAEQRTRIVEDYPIGSLFWDADAVVTLHSQGALEAVAAGLPVSTLANPFYAQAGFTSDFTSSSAFAAATLERPELFALSPAQERAYLRYMTHCFRTLVNRHEPRAQMFTRLAAFGVHPAPGAPPGKNQNAGRRGKHRANALVRKTKKLVRTPKAFFRDAFRNIARKF